MKPRILSLPFFQLLALPLPSLFLQGQVPEQDALELVEKYFSMSTEELFQLPTSLTTGSAQGWMGTPAAVYVLTQQDLMDSGMIHIADQLRGVPGMMVSKSSVSSWAVSTRSFQHRFANMQLVLQDGREIYSPVFGGILWDTADLPVEILDTIEVTRGPGATLWGTNAVNGIINIKTLPANQAQRNVLTAGGGNEHHRFATFRQGGELLGGHYYTWGKWSETGNPYYNGSDIDGYSELFKGGLRADLPGFGKEGWTLFAEVYKPGHHPTLPGRHSPHHPTCHRPPERRPWRN